MQRQEIRSNGGMDMGVVDKKRGGGVEPNSRGVLKHQPLVALPKRGGSARHRHLQHRIMGGRSKAWMGMAVVRVQPQCIGMLRAKQEQVLLGAVVVARTHTNVAWAVRPNTAGDGGQATGDQRRATGELPPPLPLNSNHLRGRCPHTPGSPPPPE